MKPLSLLKKDIEFNKGLSSLIETLKTIAVSQYRALEQRIKSFRELISAIESFFELIDTGRIDHPFLKPRGKAQAVVAVTSDRGLIGGINMQVVFTAVKELKNIPGRLIVIGECGNIYAKETGVPVTSFGGIIEEERHGQAMQLRDFLLARVLDSSFGHIKIVYPRPISFTVQRVETVSLLPYAPSGKGASGRIGDHPGIIMESTPPDIIAYLIYIWMGQVFYDIFGLSRLAEFAARFVHLEESAQKLKDLDKKLQLQYFRARHELVDRNMRELFAARALYSRG